ncbi:aspartyl protease family protein [Argonema galeatum]|uniref:aspartyl protease family protein n=1 Tax=Argonema galeatum TaxID=2942762 RepID=UPI0020122574|nr:aspartyl protease family protein [Argonema galeatum]MCL1464857.1 aspartyl protease family protein [Argonema galeatum A003/A1]
MSSTTIKEMGKLITTVTFTNLGDQFLASRGFMPPEQIRSITLENVLIDTGATRLCLPAQIINQLGLTFLREIDTRTAAGLKKARVFRGVKIALVGREGIFDCVELPGGEQPLLGVIPLEELGLEPDLKNQQLRVLPMEGNDTYVTA